MDDLTPLQQITPQTASAGDVLFKPRDAIRARIGGGRGFGGGRGGRGAGTAASSRSTARTINYYLASAPSTPVDDRDSRREQQDDSHVLERSADPARGGRCAGRGARRR